MASGDRRSGCRLRVERDFSASPVLRTGWAKRRNDSGTAIRTKRLIRDFLTGGEILDNFNAVPITFMLGRQGKTLLAFCRPVAERGEEARDPGTIFSCYQ